MPYIVNVSTIRGISQLYFYATTTQAVTDLWAASWFPTDSASVGTPYAADSLGNVNVYTYVKPMIHINDCVGDGGYDLSTASQFIAGTNCGGLGRINGIINKLNELPSGKRAFRTMRYDNGPIYDEVGDRYANGQQSPWAEKAGITLNSDVLTVFTRLGNSGAVPDYILIDSEQSGLIFDFKYGSSTNWTNQVYGITSDAKYNQTWYGSTSFGNLYTQGGSYAFGFTNIVNGTYHPQNTRDYLFWDRAVEGIHSALLNQFIVNPLKTIYPSVKISNYESMVILDGGTAGNAYDYNGHPIVRTGIVGDYAAPALYGGWAGASAAYGVLSTDTTKIVRTDYAGTTAFPSNAWNQFLVMIQNIRAVKRGSGSNAITPWIASPYYTDGSAGPYDAKWTESSTNLGLYYESIRHFALTGVKMFNYFNSAETDSTKLNTACTKLNDVLTELNTLLGSSQTTSLTSDERVDFTGDYVISGAPTNSATYLWRVTPKPGNILEDSVGNVLEVDGDGGAWVATETSTKPTFTLSLATIFIRRRSQDLTRRYYHYQVIAGTNSYVYDGWNNLIQRTFVGNPNSAADSYGHIPKASRAYPFEFNPANPATSSPWHNIIYENFNESYFAGFRALNISFPFGESFTDAPNNHTWLLHPLDQLYGTTGFSTIYSRAGACGMTCYNSTTLPEWCPARVKGFTGAVKQLLEGTMAPTGRTAMTDYCDVMLYIPGAGGWAGYRNYLHAWWDNAAATNTARDAALTQRLDQMADFISSCKASTDDKGILSVSLDIGSLTATPGITHLYRSLSDYRSDTCELATWYFAQKLKAAGIPTYTESRGQTQTNQIVINATLTGSKGTTGSVAWRNMAMDENYMWYSDPELSSSKGDNYYVSRNYVNNEAIPVAHRLSGSYLTLGTRLPWNMTTGVTYAGYTMEQYYANYGDPAGSHYLYDVVYSPYYAMSQIYAGADVYMDYLYRTRGLSGWGNRRKMKTFTTYAIDTYAICGHALLQPGKTSGSYTWWYANSVNTMPLFYGYGFTTSAATKTGVGYPTTTYTGGFWTDGVNVGNIDTISYFNTNVRGTSLGSQLAVFRKLATNYDPPGVSSPPEWLGSGPTPSPYPKYVIDDPYWNNTIDTILR